MEYKSIQSQHRGQLQLAIHSLSLPFTLDLYDQPYTRIHLSIRILPSIQLNVTIRCSYLCLCLCLASLLSSFVHSSPTPTSTTRKIIFTISKFTNKAEVWYGDAHL